MNSFYKIHEEINQTTHGSINLDIPKAYNTTWSNNIKIKLNSILCQGRKLNIITDYTSNLKFQVKAKLSSII